MCGRAKHQLAPFPEAALIYWPVDRRVGDVRNDGLDLFTPLAAPKPLDAPKRGNRANGRNSLKTPHGASIIAQDIAVAPGFAGLYRL